MELKIIWGIIWRRKYIIIQAFLIILLVTIVGSLLLVPVYKTSAKILIMVPDTESSLLSNIGIEIARAQSRVEESKKAGNNIAMAMSRSILERVISKLQLTDRKGGLVTYDVFVKQKMLKSKIFPNPYVKVIEIEDTDLIEIVAESTDPEEAAMIASTIAEECISENLRLKREEYAIARKYIEKQIDSVKAKYVNILEDIKDFQINEKTIDIESETKNAIERMSELMKEKKNTIISMSEIRAKIKKLETQLNKQDGKRVSGLSINENDYIEYLKKTISGFELQLEVMLFEKTKEHPDVAVLNRKLKKAKEDLKNEVDLTKVFSSELQNLERGLAATEAHSQGLGEEIDKYMDKFNTFPKKIFSNAKMNLEYEVNRDLYKSLLQYLHQIGVAESFILSDIRLVERAKIPDIDKPVRPKKKLSLIMGCLLGLMFGISLGFLVDYLDDTIKNPDEIEELGMLVLGVIPRFRRKESSIISERDRKDPICESYRTIRNSIRFASVDMPTKSLLITSPMASEGKTTTVVNLGLSIAYENKKVLIIDTDLRRPRIHEVFKMPNSAGITNIIAEQEEAEDVIQKTNVEGLDLLTSGPIPSDPAFLIESEKLKQLVKELTGQYDMVILDSPPVLVGHDAIVLAGYVDCSISILEYARETGSILNRVKDTFKQANTRLLGVVLSKFQSGEIGSYQYHYDYYKKT